MNTILAVRDLSKTYISGSKTLTVLKDISLEIEEGTSCAIVGPSGSGKTTLLGLCAGLDLPSTGSVVLNGVQLNNLNEDERAKVRNETIGFVFQNFQLISTLTAIENVMVPLELRGENHVKTQAEDLLEQVGLGDRSKHYPVQLSGGEQQRVALARAFINRPKILFADEPTGNLDAETSERVIELLFELNRAAGTTLVMVTHNNELARKAKRIVKLHAGSIVLDSLNKDQSPAQSRPTVINPSEIG
ncbi:ABC transporter ATP-binding protein [candidate division KSB1 bacterium]|nr:ABC transporter ATP-binding protein [candidate division KSB1 bacterium]